MKTIPVQFSGRSGDWVYYMRGRKQYRRRYVVPKDPRSPKQLRCRAAFGAASLLWSHSEQLSDQDRDHWIAAAGRIQSRPRLGQSGPLTGQQYFVGRQCAEGKCGERTADCGLRRPDRAQASPPRAQPRRAARSTSGLRRACAGPARGLRPARSRGACAWPQKRAIPTSPRSGLARERGFSLLGLAGTGRGLAACSPGACPAQSRGGARQLPAPEGLPRRASTSLELPWRQFCHGLHQTSCNPISCT